MLYPMPIAKGPRKTVATLSATTSGTIVLFQVWDSKKRAIEIVSLSPDVAQILKR